MLIRYSEQDKGLWRTEFSITVSVKDTLPDQRHDHQYDHDHHFDNRDKDDDANGDDDYPHCHGYLLL